MKKHNRTACMALLVLLISGCTSGLRNGGKVEEIIESYRQLIESQDDAPTREAESYDLQLRRSGEEMLVDGDLGHAPLATAVPRLLRDAALPWHLENAVLHGHANARFVATPLDSALDRLLAPVGLRASWIDEGVVIRMQVWEEPEKLERLPW